jgi:uncharacterized membrane protein YgdD (TMEM256/DUF423 family)
MGQIHSNMKKITAIAGSLGLTGVALGAFGAHALKTRLAESGYASTWETAVLFHLLHALALYALSRGQVESWHQNNRVAGCWTLGVLLFSGSLYALALGGPKWLGPVTPVGGLFLIAGWAFVIREGLRKNAMI